MVPIAAGVLVAAGCQIPEPGPRVGGDRVARLLLCDLPAIGEIRNLEWLPASGTDDGSLWIGGAHGVVRATRDGVERERVVFDRRLTNPRPIDVDGDGSLETMDCGRGWAPVGLLDDQGGSLWRYPRGDGLGAADAMAAGPIGENGDIVFAVGMNGGGGLRFLDREGEPLFRLKATNVFSVAITDLDGDGAEEIVHSDGGPRDAILVRHADGCAWRQLDLEFVSFGLVRWPDADSPTRLSGGDEDTVQIVDPWAEPGASVLAEFDLPDEGFSVDHGQVLPVRLGSEAESYVAVQRTIRATWERSALYIYDAQCQLVYHEVFPVSVIGIVVVPPRFPGGAEELLVGAGSRVHRYELLSKSPVASADPVAN